VDPKSDLRQRLIRQRVIPVLRLQSAELTGRAAGCLADAGFGAIEVTMTTPNAFTVIRHLRSENLAVGAGTVLDLDTAQRCIDAGAQFLVSPCVVPGMAALAHRTGRLALIGGYTPGEILAAHREGADIVKLFPASSGGPDHLRAIHAVMPEIPLCPTGGVSLQNMQAYFDAGATVVGVGNHIVDQAALAAGKRSAVIAHAKRFLQ
jgi:2-dehydro-3-deoxyphosphogluconate aldolase / (4S)-4-hydroxy-2-oxoglutarate aldolase